MKTTLILFVVLLLALMGYAYHKNPAGCMKIVDDFGVIFQSISPVRVHVEMADPSSPSPVPVYPPTPTPTPTPGPLPGIPQHNPSTSTAQPSPGSLAALKKWVAPTTLPQQVNWIWTMSDGKKYQDVKITKVEADCVTILDSEGGALVPISELPADLQKQLNYDPEAAVAASMIRAQQEEEAAQEIAAEKAQAQAEQDKVRQRIQTLAKPFVTPSVITGGHLVSANGSEWNFNPSGGAVDYLAIYFSAHWCPPCRAFTPRLVQWYNGFKPSHPNFELIFVSDDHDEASMFDYMTTMSMPWPAVRYDDRETSGLTKFANTGIPDLVLVSSTGQVLSDSFQGSNYLGPEHVLDDIQKQLGH
jgi:thiol-disulfide isomerase/thioredoxin